MITKSYTPPGVDVSFEMMTYTPVRVMMLIQSVQLLYPAEQIGGTHHLFEMVMGHTKNIHFGDSLPVEWQALRDYWTNRTHRTLEDFEAFTLLHSDVTQAWWNAYEATRPDSNPVTEAAAPSKSRRKKKETV